MKKFKITVNGEVYEVEVEEIGEVVQESEVAKVAAPAPRVSVPSPPPNPVQQPKSTPKEAPKAAPRVVAGSGSITAPMPGVILDVKVTEGQKVNAGDVLLVLEAMKMENEITAPSAGVISQVAVSKGASVNAGDVLVSIS